MSDSMTRRSFVKSVGYSGVATAALAGLTAADGAEPESAGKARAGRLSAEKIRIGTLVPGNARGPPTTSARSSPTGSSRLPLCFWQHLGDGRLAQDGRRSEGGAGRQRGGRSPASASTAIRWPTTNGPSTRSAWKQLIDAARPVRRKDRRGFCRPGGGQAGAGLDAAFRRGLRSAGQTGARQGPAAGLRELRDGRRLAPRRLEHRPQSHRLGNDVQRGPRWTTSAWNGSRAHQMCNLIDPLPQLRK